MPFAQSALNASAFADTWKLDFGRGKLFEAQSTGLCAGERTLVLRRARNKHFAHVEFSFLCGSIQSSEALQVIEHSR